MYNYKFVNGHCLVEINENEWWLLDSGCPVSFSFSGSVRNLIIDGKTYILNNNPGYNPEALINAIEYLPNGIIGADILAKTSFTIYSEEYDGDERGKIEFRANPYLNDNPIDVNIRGNVIIGEIDIEGKNVGTLFETGAAINYIRRGVCEQDIRSDEWIDYDKDNKKIISKPCITVSNYAGQFRKLSFGILIDNSSSPAMVMDYYKVDAIMGLYDKYMKEPIFWEYIVFDYKNKKIYIR